MATLNANGHPISVAKDHSDRQHYLGLNRRFDKRFKLLYRFGFRPDHVKIDENNWVFFLTRTRYGIKRTVLFSFVMNADKRAWLREVESLLLRCVS